MEMTQIAIIGGGFAGISTALHWLRFFGAGQNLMLFDSAVAHGDGLADQSQSLNHLLSEPVENLGLFFDDPRGFLFWLHERGFTQFKHDDFVPRFLFDEYIQDFLQYFKSRYSTFVTSKDEVVSIQKYQTGYLLETETGRKIYSQIVIGAWSRPRRKLKIDSEVPCIDNIWDNSLEKNFLPGTRFAILGAGPGLVDFVSDISEHNPTAEFWCLSKFGLLPALSEQTASSTAEQDLPGLELQGSPLQVLKQVRQYVASNPNLSSPTIVWQIKASSTKVWRTWSLRQKSQFLRHINPYWQIFQIQLPPILQTVLQELKNQGRLTIHAGRLESIFHDEILWRPRGEERLREEKFDYLVPIQEPENNIALSPQLLHKQLYNQGVVVPDANRTGIQTDLKGRPIDSKGDIHRNFYLIGPLLTPIFGEASSVAEIRLQIYNLLQSFSEVAQIQVDSNL